jgi:intracellular multiplication protein IcmE
MAEKIPETRKRFDTKTRSMLIIIIIILIIAVAIGFLSFRRALKGPPTPAKVPTAPRITAIPGVGEVPPREYVRLQEEQARKEAEEALRKKGAALPTVVRPTYVDTGFQIPTAKPGAPTPPGCGIEELRRARRAGVSAFELRCRGCDAAALKAAGYTAGELRDAGFTCQPLKAAGFTAAQLKAGGFTAEELKECFSVAELKAAGYSQEEITPTKKIDCSVDALRKAHQQEVSAATLKECGAAALKAAGYTAKELKDAGFTAGELRRAGFSAKQLKDAGFSAKDLKNAGFSAEDLKNAGFTPDELKAAGYTDGDLVRAGFPPKAPPAVAPKPTVAVPTIAPEVTLAPAPKPAEEADIQAELAKIRAQQAAQLSQQEWENQVQQLQQNMSAQATDLFSSWTPLPKQQYVEGEVAKESPEQAAAAKAAAVGKQPISGDILKAGTILFAVLDTGINSDEPGPIMATITQGKLKGSKVLGSYKREKKKVVLQFSTLSVPYLDSSMGIKAYGVDPELGRVAMATSVDSHYLYRYGTYFAASFIGGLGDAIQNSKSTITTTIWGTTTQQYSDLDPVEEALVALGDVGQKMRDILEKDIDTPPTVRVKAGSGIGLLLMSDLTVPKGK